ncbi:hypothetical protein ACP275_14G133800 [Erythranthe tilingii]
MFLQLQVIAWQEIISPCLLEEASIILQLGFLAIISILFIKNNVDSSCKRRNKSSGQVEDQYHTNDKYTLSYKLALISSITILVTQLVALLDSQQNTANACGPHKALVLSSRITQVISWSITLITLCKIRKNTNLIRKNTNLINFPWILRSWWILSFLLSITRSIIDVHSIIKNHNQLGIQEYADIINLAASTILLGLSIRGKTGLGLSAAIILENGINISEPLLNGKNENHSQATNKRDTNGSGFFAIPNSSPYGRATLIQLITFSWLNPLFEYGFKKPLDQEEVPDDKTQTPSIYKAIYIFARKKAAINALFAIAGAATSYVGPYLIKFFVDFLNEKRSRSLSSGYFLVLGFLVAKLVETITQQQWMFGARQLGLRLRAALTSQVYKKSLILSNQTRQSRTSGEIINIMSVDVQRITDFTWYLNTVLMLPIQISLAIFILHMNLGNGAFVALGVTLLVMAVNVPLTRMQKGYQTKIMEAKDERMKATSEVLRNIKTLKLEAWDIQYLKKIESLRQTEHNWLWKCLRLTSVTTFIFWGSPAFISVITFAGSALMEVPLKAGMVLSALATFRMLQDPIFNLPDLLNAMAQGKVSIDRISSYLQEDEIKSNPVDIVENDETGFHIEVIGGKFGWEIESKIPILDNINLRVEKGMKVAVCGTVGSGKSSLLSCVLGEMEKLSGAVRITGTKAYVPQSPWILTGNIRENILFGKGYDGEKYWRTIDACALAKDFELFGAGDLTEIGERGINMSGGQKQRIQIARAVYQDADIYSLDDPFSAVDAHTGTQLFKDCLMGILKEKTIVYVTHQVEFLPAADLILVMQNGKIAQAGTFNELLKHKIGFEALVGAHNQALESVQTVENSSRISDHAAAAAADNEADTTANQDNLREEEGRLVQDEEREKGSIGREVYLSYLTTAKRGGLVPIIVLAQTSFQMGIRFVLFVYTLLALGSALCVLIRASLVAVAGLLTSEKMFSNMLESVFRAPMAFFDSTPTGRILNRASMDQSVLDIEVASKLGWGAFSIIQLLGTIAVMSQVAWQVFVVFIPVTAICIWYQQYYIRTARELARLAGIERSPILHHFAESLAGTATIRAFNQQERFTDANLSLIDNHSRPWFHNVSAMEWLSFRLNQLANFVFAFSLDLLVTLPQGTLSPSIAGLAVTYGINLNVWQAAYSNLASEAPLVIEESRPPSNWPHFGTICFENLQIRYAEHLPSVLKNITCTFPGRKKIGVVGRTGSGKSTLIQAIFRIVEPREGTIIIDDVDISKIGLHDLRSRVSIIPQDPTMFEGTALDKCQLGDIVRQKEEKLESTVVENGENWSVGQRQLFCLGRALLKKSSILVLDEATASVDSATDGVIQKVISREFKDRTVVTIAHRIHTVIDSDLVLVLSDGRIAEYDSPAKLLERENSFFSKLIKEYSMRSRSFNNIPKLE